MKAKEQLIRKSIAASILIGLGNFILLKIGNPIGPFLFSLGLLGVCYMDLNLFTGKCGFFIENKMKITDLLLILVFNLIGGYLIGLLFSVTDTAILQVAKDKVATWDISLAFFLKSVLCGMIMYIAVLLYKKGTPFGILLGVPMFILCGFQHCIANIITLGVAQTFHLSIFICILGNFIGSLTIWYFSRDVQIETKKTIFRRKKQ